MGRESTISHDSNETLAVVKLWKPTIFITSTCRQAEAFCIGPLGPDHPVWPEVVKDLKKYNTYQDSLNVTVESTYIFHSSGQV